MTQSANQTPKRSVEIAVGDLLAADAQTLVNTVNTVGIMGKGIALQFKNRFPDMFEDYRARCDRGEVKLGQPYLYRRLIAPHILNFPTKEHWRSVSRLDDILHGLDYLEEHYQEWDITSLAVPPLGCGQGGLEWRVVGPTLYQRLARLDIPVTLFAPFGTPHEELKPTYLNRPLDDIGTADDPEHFLPSRIAPGWVVLVSILDRLERNPYHRPVGRTSFQKLAYFATDKGVPTGLKFVRGSYGPYADELKKVQTALVNNGLIREERRGQMIAYKVGPTYEAARRAYEAELEGWDEEADDLAQLMTRMRTKDAEIAATVHFVAGEFASETGKLPTERQVLDAVMEWKRRRTPQWDAQEVAATVRHLALRGWLRVRASRDLPLDELRELGVRSPETPTRHPKAASNPSLF